MILHLIPQDVDGCAYHRIEVPMVNLEGFELARTTVIDGVNDEDLKNISLVVFSRDSCMVEIVKQVKRLKKLRIPYVIDIDDYWKLNEEHLLYREFTKHTRPRWEFLMQNAAAVTTTTSRLAAKIQRHNKNVEVIPNAIDISQPQWQYFQRPKTDSPVFGWVGGTHHMTDLALLKPTFEQIHKENIVTLALGGWSIGNKVFHAYENWMTGGGKYKKYKRIKGEDVYNYGRIYDLMDVCLVPLLEGQFTACKSPLKLIEAGFKSKPCIVSRVAPYIDDFTDKEVLFIDENNWHSQIMKLHKNPNILFDYRDALNESVQRFEIKKVNHIREQLYLNIINGR